MLSIIGIILGIVSFVGCLFPICGLVMSAIGLAVNYAAYKDSVLHDNGQTKLLAQIGMVLSGLVLVLTILYFILVIFVIVCVICSNTGSNA